MLIAQITDLHTNAERAPSYCGIDCTARLSAVIDLLSGSHLNPDLVLVSGDLADDGDYDTVKNQLERLTVPFYVIPGNHDDVASMRAAFSHHEYISQCGEFIQYAISEHQVRLIGLDTTVKGSPGGALCQQRLGWLANCLAQAPSRPTMIFMHHPPMKTGIGGLDRFAFAGAERFAALITANPQVELVTCGHVHRSMTSRIGNALISTAPSTTYTFQCELGQQDLLKVSMEATGFQLHAWSEDAGFLTHTVMTEGWDTWEPVLN